jgi:hypothetical protein
MSMKKLVPLALLLAAPLTALADPPQRKPGEPRTDGLKVEEARKGGAKVQMKECAFAPADQAMKSGDAGALRVMLVDESGTLRYLGTLEETMPSVGKMISFQTDPVRGGT